jgi:hypothetical protein
MAIDRDTIKRVSELTARLDLLNVLSISPAKRTLLASSKLRCINRIAASDK